MLIVDVCWIVALFHAQAQIFSVMTNERMNMSILKPESDEQIKMTLLNGGVRWKWNELSSA